MHKKDQTSFNCCNYSGMYNSFVNSLLFVRPLFLQMALLSRLQDYKSQTFNTVHTATTTEPVATCKSANLKTIRASLKFKILFA